MAVVARGPSIGWHDHRETLLTYEALDMASNSLAHSLRSLGVKKGDRVAVSLGNSAEYAALTYAIFKLGAILVPLNPGFNAKQVAAALNHLGVRILIMGAVTDLAYKPSRGRSNLPLLQELIADPDSEKIQSEQIPTLEQVVIVDNSSEHPECAFPPLHVLRCFTRFGELLPSFNLKRSSPSVWPVVPDEPLSADETINIQFTSGTTSHPKAAMLSHTSILNNGHLIAHRMGMTRDDAIVCPPPLFHCFGSVLGFMATATTGAAILFPSPAFDPLASLRMVADYQATGLYGVTTMFIAMLELLASEETAEYISPIAFSMFPSHLRKGIAAGSSVPESLMRRLYETLGLRELVICYGMTETSPVSCMTTPKDPFLERTRSVGQAMPHTRVKVVDPSDRSRVVAVGERGELAAAGYLVMQGYYGDEERTREVRVPDEDGTVWMYSGDEATMDAEGYVQITGRIKDLIIRGGENIHPLEIENWLLQHPLISDASVVGVPDEKLGESIGAFIIPHKGVKILGDKEKAGLNSLNKHVIGDWVRTHLSAHLVPKHVFWVDEYPKTASGKVQKFKLREMAKELVALAPPPMETKAPPPTKTQAPLPTETRAPPSTKTKAPPPEKTKAPPPTETQAPLPTKTKKGKKPPQKSNRRIKDNARENNGSRTILRRD